MSLTFDIIGWNPVNNGQEVQASVYIKPTLEFLEFCNRAPLKTVIASVKGTGNSYIDDKRYFAVIDKSSEVPSYRYNLFNGTGLYVVSLNLTWVG